MDVKDALNDDEARANRDRYHWSEVDLGAAGGWLKEWMELNLDEQVLYETEDYKLKCRNSYKDSGECLLHARKGKVFATYNLDLMVKWYAIHKLDGRIVGEARGRFNVKEFSSEHVTTEGAPKEDAPAFGDITNEGEWDFKKPGMQGDGAEEMKKQNPGLKDKPGEEPGADVSDAEKHLKKVMGERGLEPLKARLAHLHSQLADLANSREAAVNEGKSCPLPDPIKVPELDCDRAMRAEASTKQMVRDIKAKMRNPKFLPAVEAIEKRTIRNAELRCLSLSDDDIPAVVAALPPKQYEPAEGDVLLEILDLSYNEITDVGVQQLMFALAAGNAPHLKTFNLGKTQITDIGKRQLTGLKMLRKTLNVIYDVEPAE